MLSTPTSASPNRGEADVACKEAGRPERELAPTRPRVIRAHDDLAHAVVIPDHRLKQLRQGPKSG